MRRLREVLRKARAGVDAMPVIMRMFCGGAMLATPILLLAISIPTIHFNVDGREVAFREMWASGLAPVIAAFLLLGGIASWGLALRWPGARWVAVITPLVPFALAWLLPRSDFLSTYQQATTFWSTLPYAIGMYLCLFHIPSVKRYSVGTKPATTPNTSLERTREG